jgi:hypothetical protein
MTRTNTRPRPALRLVEPATPTAFEDWREANAERLWWMLQAQNLRDQSFNEYARSLWEQL